MLDTNTISYIARNRSAQARIRFKEAESEAPVCLSSLTEAEILYGIAKRPEATRMATVMHDALSRLMILPWTSEAAKSYGDLRARNERSGLSLGAFDMLIAAHALSSGMVLVTSDGALRRLLGGPVTVNWADDLRPN